MSAAALRRIALSPWMVLVSIVAGVAIGATAPEFAHRLGVVNDLYVRLFNITVAPILIAVLATSFGKLVQRREAGRIAARFAVIVALAMLVVATVAALSASAAHVGSEIGSAARTTLGGKVEQAIPFANVALGNGDVPEAPEPRLVQFILLFIPANAYRALQHDVILQVLPLGLIFGLALGAMKRRSRERCFAFLDGILDAWLHVADMLLTLLPIAVLTLIADKTATSDRALVTAMGSFTLWGNACFLALVLAAVAITAVRRRISFGRSLRAQRDVLMLAFATRSSFACLPTAMDSLEVLRLPRDVIELVLPLAVNFGRFGSTAFFAFASIFAANLYGVELPLTGIALTIVLAVVAGLATSGGGGIPAIPLIAVILDNFGIPSETVIVVLTAIDVVVDPLRTATTIAVANAATALVAPAVGAPVAAAEPLPAIIAQAVPSE